MERIRYDSLYNHSRNDPSLSETELVLVTGELGIDETGLLVSVGRFVVVVIVG